MCVQVSPIDSLVAVSLTSPVLSTVGLYDTPKSFCLFITTNITLENLFLLDSGIINNYASNTHICPFKFILFCRMSTGCHKFFMSLKGEKRHRLLRLHMFTLQQFKHSTHFGLLFLILCASSCLLGLLFFWKYFTVFLTNNHSPRHTIQFG